MIRILLFTFILFVLAACQVDEEVSSGKKTGQNFNTTPARFDVILPQDGWKKLGDPISVTLLFNRPIDVTGSPYINAIIGTSLRRLYYYSGSGSNAIVFRYVVSSLDHDTDGVEFANSIVLNGGRLSYQTGEGMIVDIPTSLTLPPSHVMVDGVPPMITTVAPPGAASYTTGQSLEYKVSFSEPVFVTGAPSFEVNLGSGVVLAQYITGSGTYHLTFRHTLTPGDVDNNGFSTGSLLNLNTMSDITIKDEAGNILSPVFPVTSSSSLINIAGPSIVNITTPAPATYVAGQNLDFTVTFSAPVNITGMPSIPIQLTTGKVHARYLSGTGTNTVVFRYTVLSNQQDLNGITLLSPMLLNSGSIKNLDGTLNANLTYTPPATPSILVDSVIGATALSVILPTAGTYVEGQTLDFIFSFNRPVTVSGSPQLQINLGAGIVTADYEPSLSSANLVGFRYQVLTGNADIDGITLASPLLLNGGSIVDANNLAANLFYSVPDATMIRVDAIAPAITGVTAPANGTYVQGQKLTLKLSFSEPVIVSGSPQINLDVGSSAVVAQYESGSNSTELTFSYLIQNGDVDTNGVVFHSPIDLNGGSIKDPYNHDLASLAFVAPVTTGVLVDSEAPGILGITAPANGIYNTGDLLEFIVTWSEPVSFSGTPQIALDIGGTTVYASYYPAGSTPTASSFRLIITGDLNDADGITMSSPIQLNGGYIGDSNSNPAILNFTSPSLAGVLIDGYAPSVASIIKPVDGIYTAGTILEFTLNWTEPVTIIGIPTLKLVIGPTVVNATYQPLSSGPTSSVFRYTVLSGDLDTNGIELNTTIYLNTATITDLHGNNAWLSLNVPGLMGVKVDGIAPTVSNVVAPTDTTYHLYESLNFTISWTEAVLVTGTPRLMLNVGGSTYYANYNSVASTDTQLVFTYIVGLDHNDSDGISVLPALPANPTIDLNGGLIRDLAGNLADLNYYRPVTTGVLVDGRRPIINSISAPSSNTYTEGESVSFVVNWSEPVNVSGGTPRLVLTVGTSTAYANYVSGSGTSAFTFTYVVAPGDEDLNGIYRSAFIDLNGSTIQDASLNQAKLDYLAMTYTGVKVDGKNPVMTSSYPSKKSFMHGQYLDIIVNYHEAVYVTGTPRIQLNINGVTKYANFVSGSGTTQLRFRYLVESLSTLIDLDGIGVSASIALNGGTIQDNVGHSAGLVLNLTEKIYVHPTSILARYHFNDNDYTTAPCGSLTCISGVQDISGNNNHITSGSNPGPVLGSGFATNGTGYAKFNNASYLNIPNFNVRSVLVVIKSPSVASWMMTSTYYTWLTNSFSAQYIGFSSNFYNKYINTIVNSQVKVNLGFLSNSSTQHTQNWNLSNPYIYQFHFPSPGPQLSLGSGPRLGGSTFDGQIAEVIFFSSSLTTTQMDALTTQLNNIHGVY